MFGGVESTFGDADEVGLRAGSSVPGDGDGRTGLEERRGFLEGRETGGGKEDGVADAARMVTGVLEGGGGGPNEGGGETKVIGEAEGDLAGTGVGEAEGRRVGGASGWSERTFWTGLATETAGTWERIQGRNGAMRMFMPGKPGRAQPFPEETIARRTGDFLAVY